MFNMLHSRVLSDLHQLFKEFPEMMNWIDEYGLKTLLEDCRINDQILLEQLKLDFADNESVEDFNHMNGTKYTSDQIVAVVSKNCLLLPHADYKHFDNIVNTLLDVYEDHPKLFEDFTTRPYAVIHNELMEYYNNLDTLE